MKKSFENEFKTTNPYKKVISDAHPFYTIEDKDGVKIYEQKNFHKTKQVLPNVKVKKWTNKKEMMQYVETRREEIRINKETEEEAIRKRYKEKYDGVKARCLLDGHNAFFYVDGSHNDGYSTAGCVLELDGEFVREEAFRFDKINNVYGEAHRFEHYAVVAAILMAKEMGIDKFVIFTDSAGVISDAKKGSKRDQFGKQFRKWIRTQSNEMDIEFKKVKGHVGIEGNDRADRLAWNARTNRATPATSMDVESILHNSTAP